MSMVNVLHLAEMLINFPVSEASYYFLKRSLGCLAASLSLWLRFFVYFLDISAQGLPISIYLIHFFYSGCPTPELPPKYLVLVILWSFGIFSARGIETMSKFQTVTNLMIMSSFCLISITGIMLLVIGEKNVSRFENALNAELLGAFHIADAILQAYYSFLESSLLINRAGKYIHKYIWHCAKRVCLECRGKF